jgi:hypothetical protein
VDYLIIRSAGAAMAVPGGTFNRRVTRGKLRLARRFPDPLTPTEMLSVTVRVHHPPDTPRFADWGSSAVVLPKGAFQAAAFISVTDGRCLVSVRDSSSHKEAS